MKPQDSEFMGERQAVEQAAARLVFHSIRKLTELKAGPKARQSVTQTAKGGQKC